EQAEALVSIAQEVDLSKVTGKANIGGVRADEISIPQEKLDRLIEDLLGVRAAHRIQGGVIEALVGTLEEMAPAAIARVEAMERDKELEELHQRSTTRPVRSDS